MEMLPLPNERYTFIIDIFSAGNYYFQTRNNAVYNVIFKPSPYIFGEEQPFAFLLYEFSILAWFEGQQSFVKDELIAPTIVAIFLNFYQLQSDTVCFYICDSADNRQQVRKRKFDTWFNHYNDGTFIKLDSEIQDVDGVRYPIALIMKANNPFRQALGVAFVNLISGYSDEK